MILNVTKAEYLKDYQIIATFNNGETKIVDLKETIFSDNRRIFEPLRDINNFMKFKIKFNTIEWANGADLAPEYSF